ncbi:MAG TPA: 4'-phosphopantetheinyl transferase superfamily protein [Terriglobales bacterium]|nr:4'-phosphopantetheinyl transferase superfamily protein [Terriglobales bacterium]
MDVYWLEQTQSEVPSGDDWLSESEAVRLDSMRFEKRRADWRLGRWTAKHALAAWLKLEPETDVLRSIELRAQTSGAPEPYFGGRHAEVSISLSHSSGVAMCAVAGKTAQLGCDLERIEQRSAAFVSDYFTLEEQRLIAGASTSKRLVANLIWSAKESALKALKEGLRRDTRSVEVTFDNVSVGAPDRDRSWRVFYVTCGGERRLQGWWQCEAELVRTLVAEPAPREPVRIAIPARTGNAATAGTA